MPSSSLTFFDLYRQNCRATFLNRLFFSLVNLFFNLDQAFAHFSNFNRWIGQTDFPRASGRLLRALRVQPETVNPPVLDSQAGYLFFGNHPSPLDPFSVISTLNSPRLKLIVEANYLQIGSHFAKHVLPVMFYQAQNGRLVNKGFGYRLYRLFFRSLLKFNPREAALAYNRQTTAKAAAILARRGQVLIFPYASDKNQISKGIGHLLSQALSQKTAPIYLVPFYLDLPHSPLLFLKIIFKVRPVIRFRLTYGSPRQTASFSQIAADPKRLAQKIDREYQKFLSSKPF